MCMCVGVYAHMCMCVCVHVSMCACVCVHVYLYVNVNVYRFMCKRGKLGAQIQRKAGLWSDLWGVRQEGWALHIYTYTS